MSATADNAGKPKRKRRWFQFSLRTLFVLVAVVAGVAWMVASILQFMQFVVDSEEELYAMTDIPYVVEAFVEENDGAWPRSWEELKAGPQRVHHYTHHVPIDYDLVQRNIVIDFDADPAELARQSPTTFVAIRPIKGFYDYSGDHGIKKLIETLKRHHPNGP